MTATSPVLPKTDRLDYKVADLSPATVRFGRKEIELAQHEMPGLMALRKEYAGKKPLSGARIWTSAAGPSSSRRDIHEAMVAGVTSIWSAA